MHETTAPSAPLRTSTAHGGVVRSLLRPTHGWSATALCIVGAVLLVGSAVIHLHLWSTGYRNIPTIGPLFLLQGVAGIVLAAVVVVFRSPATSAAGAAFSAGTVVGLLLSVEVGLFGFKDSFGAPYAMLSLVVEVVATVVLLAATVLGVRALRADRPVPGG